MSRLCGYCRMAGHQHPKCPQLHSMRRRIFKHTVEQRSSLVVQLAAAGFYNGAMLEMKESWISREKKLFTIINFHEVIPDFQFTQYKRVKYSKQVSVEFEYVSKDYFWKRFHFKGLTAENGLMVSRLLYADIAKLLPSINIDAFGHSNDAITYHSEPLKVNDIDWSLFDDKLFESNIWIPDKLLIADDGGMNYLKRENLKNY